MMTFTTTTPEGTEALGRRLGALLGPGDQLHLIADLGVGKTVLARGVIRVAVGAEVEVPSPTFSLVLNYEGDCPIAHADLYRTEDPSEVLELGLEDALDRGALVVEWPGHGEGYLPNGALTITGTQGEGDTRQWQIAGDAVWQKRLEELERQSSQT
ncbi:MAG: tRNA (adenosine(37)-N6)-threonylcarbamoyltransferase complex ATPase subunit type 1 TsaE [Pseudomonadota bacterium]